MSKFVHLHVHSEYSLLDGLPKLKNLVARAKDLEMEAVALTDHGTMYGVIEFYNACKKKDIKPIIGMEGYVVNGSHKKKEGKEDSRNLHLILLAKNKTGYANLMKLSTIAYLEGFYYRPRFDKETLKKYSEGLICLSACAKGEVAQHLIEDEYEKAKETALWYQELFGDDYYLEIQRHQYLSFLNKTKEPKIIEKLKYMQQSEDVYVAGIIKLSRELGIPLVATNDVHYLKQEDSFAQDALVCVSTGKLVSDIDRLRYVDNPTFHFRTEEEMAEIFSDVPDALENTYKVSQKVNLELEMGAWLFPNFPIPEGLDAATYLRKQAQKLLPEKIENPDEEVLKRLKYELDVIIQKGYASYFLMMADLVSWCTERGIVTNTRGSAAGSIVSFALGITLVNPVKYSLPFERFLNPFRPKPPDIDLDIADNRREDLINYITDTYGKDKVAQICTFGRMLARAAVRDIGRVLGYPYSFPDKISKLIPMGAQGFPMTIKKALDVSPELKVLYDSDPEAKKIINLAEQIEGNARHASVHAAGTIISPTNMTDYCPLQLEPNGTKIITQYEMHACEEIGLVKFDVLGIRNLSILTSAVEIIKNSLGVELDLTKIPLDDKKVFTMLGKGETMGVFQLGGSGMTKWLMELKPNRIEDIMVIIALFRPGPMANIPEFIERKNGKKFEYLHPKMAEFLDKSYGILVYQEDILFTALELAGYNWETVDTLRNAIGKKIPEEMAKQHEIFVEGCQKFSEIPKEEAEKIWDLFVPFQGYGFNKAHAASYGFVSYQTAYVKAHYPVEYMTALLTAESGDTDKITEALTECKRMGIFVLSPDINTSMANFTIEKNEKSLESKAIRFGFSAVKNVGAAAIEAILKAREDGQFKSLTDLCKRADSQKVNKKVLESLIKAGGMDKFGKRAQMLAGLDLIRSKGENEQKKKNGGQASLFSEEESDVLEEKDDLPEIEEFNKNELLTLEKELLGFYLTEHPLAGALSILSTQVTHLLSVFGEEVCEVRGKVKIGGIISKMRVITTKAKGEEMAFATIDDGTGKAEVVVFPKTFAKSRSAWIVDQIVILDGKVEMRDDAISIIVEEAASFNPNDINKPEYDFKITIPKGTQPEKLLKLNALLKSHLGEQKGILFFENNGHSKKLILNFGVDYDMELEENIENLLINDE